MSDLSSPDSAAVPGEALPPAAPPTECSMPRARRNVAVLVAAQAILGAQMSMIFTVGGLAGQSLASNPCFATLPLSLIILGSVLSSTRLSRFMQHYGRRAGFTLATGSGALGAAISAAALWYGSFGLFMFGALFTGVYMSAQGFYRFAATDTAPPEFQAKAISYVMAGGLAAAILGPQLVKVTSQAMVVPFFATYLAVIVLNLTGPLLFSFLDIPRTPPAPKGSLAAGRPLKVLLRQPVIIVAMICATVSYALMNLVMTSTPLAVVGCGFTEGHAADIVSAHVLAMYLPSFFTGHLIARFGKEVIVGLGLVILAASGLVALSGVELEQFFVALILLGVGWNFGFIGSTAMLTSAHKPEERGTIQGVNDFVVFGGVFLASLSSGGLMNCSGGTVEAGWQAVNLAMVPFLVAAGGALIWLILRPREA
ncbi:MFS transporter [Frigidibacter albus]|uniref:MFS transporter n=2 Tax=Frigidibacter albus TaxID=1465486 RepID=A0A6L8VCR1_9RHOB|nr:MFS transporter [Frigidibacter albus]NBE30312.1 MFS transporter [Frigidibacter albus]